MQETIIKKGERFMCIRDVKMSDTQQVYYNEGKIYESEIDGCITNEKSDQYHQWDSYPIINEHFVLVDSDNKLHKIIDSTEGQKNDSDKLPYFTVLFKQFPNAIQELVRCSNSGHRKYSETDKDWMNFSRVENADTRYKNAGLRHMLESGPVEDMSEYGGMSHEGAVVWNFMADLEIKLRNEN